MNELKLIDEAILGRKRSYSPYSKFKVGAAILLKNGSFIHGCNIENVSYGLSNCAERTAFFKAVSEGSREFECIAIAGGASEKIRDFCPPCGVCRQVMMEFCDPVTFKIILVKSENEYREMLLKDLLPEGFGALNIK